MVWQVSAWHLQGLGSSNEEQALICQKIVKQCKLFSILMTDLEHVQCSLVWFLQVP